MALRGIQILNRSDFGEELGSAIGSGLGEGLQILAQQRLQKMAQREMFDRNIQGLQAIGLSPEEASGIAQLDPSLQQQIIKNYLQASEMSGLEQALGSLSGTPVDITTPEETAQALNVPATIETKIPKPEMLIPKNIEQENISAIPGTGSKEINRRLSLAEVLKNPRLKPEHRLQIAKMQQQERLAERKIQEKQKLQERKFDYEREKIATKESKEAYDDIVKKAKSAKDNNMRLDRMEQLLERGKLTSPEFNSIIKTVSKGFWGLGFDLNFLRTADSQEFDKLSADFLKDAKSIFGARLTNFDVESFLKTVPTLAQTDEGKQRVINNLRAFNEAANLRKKAMVEIIKENNGKRPANLNLLIDERIDPELDIIAAKFKEGYGAPAKRIIPEDEIEDMILGIMSGSQPDLRPSVNRLYESIEI